MDPQTALMLQQQFAQITGGVVDSVDPEGTNYLAQAFKGNAQFGTLGMAASLLTTKKRRKALHNQTLQQLQDERMLAQTRPVDQEQIKGFSNSDYYATGGQLLPYRVTGGGKAQALNSDSVEIEGRSHEQGGVQLDNGAEVEDGETIDQNYVFSEALGFAALHKPLAKAILLNSRVDKLKQLQELVKSQL
jgi:hypothetical protein